MVDSSFPPNGVGHSEGVRRHRGRATAGGDMYAIL